MKKIILIFVFLFCFQSNCMAWTFTGTVSETQFEADNTGWKSCTWLDSDDLFIVYEDGTDSYKPYYQVLRWGGSSFSTVISKTKLADGYAMGVSSCMLDSDDLFVAYGSLSTQYLRYQVLRWSGSGFSTVVTEQGDLASAYSDAQPAGACMLDSDDLFLAVKRGSNSAGYVSVARWNGSALSMVVNTQTYTTIYEQGQALLYDTNKLFYAYQNSSNQAAYVTFSWNGSALTEGTTVTIDSATTLATNAGVGCALLSANNIGVFYSDSSKVYFKTYLYTTSLAQKDDKTEIIASAKKIIQSTVFGTNKLMLLYTDASNVGQYIVYTTSDGYAHKIYGVAPKKVNGVVPKKINGI